MMGITRTALPYFVEYAEQKPEQPAPSTQPAGDQPDGDQNTEQDEIVIPEDLSSVNDADLANLHTGAVDAFNALYGEDGSDLTEEGFEALSVLTAGIERVQTEVDARNAKKAQRQTAAAELAQKAGITLAAESGDDESGDDNPEADPDAVDPTEGGDNVAPAPARAPVDAPPSGDDGKGEQSLAAKTIRVNLSGLRSRQTSVPSSQGNVAPTGAPTKMSDIVKAANDFNVVPAGEGLDWDSMAKGLDRRLASFNRAQWEQANAAGRHMRQQLGMAVIQKPFTDAGLVLNSNDPRDADKVMSYATQESRLPGNSLVAAGGWCAPSETIYDLLEMESRDGLFDLPTIGITRGGINATPGPDFSDIFALATGFHYTEAQDIAGEYGVDANGVGNGTAGSKPCFRVPCPEFEETRLDYDGLCITAGLLQQRGYPEMIARTIRGALIAHDHRMAGKVLAATIAGSDAVSMPAGQVGATAPILTAIELQVEHYRQIHRLTRGTSLEAVFPFWVHGAIRSDLSRRLGVDLMDVPDARIDQWFRDRGIAPQFVYNFDDLTGTSAQAVAWPTEVRFVLYVAGTWVRGTADIITLDTIYDSVLLGQNDYTALFTEEGWLVVKRGHDSRVVTVPISPDGATHGGVDIAADGSLVTTP